jgi:Mrp family chromosome partitioning ATPase
VSGAAADPQVPVFELLPAFEEESGTRVRAEPVAGAFLDGRSPQGEQLRLLALRLRALGKDKRLRRIGVIGCGAGEGTTTVALGLAHALAARREGRVLLLELDLGHPTLDRELGLGPPAVGLRQYLEGRGDAPVLRRAPGGFWALSAGAGSTGGGSPRPSPRLDALLRATDRVFDYVIADCPPLLDGEEAVAPTGHLDGFVFVVRSRRSRRETVRRAAFMLRPELIVGVVLNAQRDFLPR